MAITIVDREDFDDDVLFFRREGGERRDPGLVLVLTMGVGHASLRLPRIATGLDHQATTGMIQRMLDTNAMRALVDGRSPQLDRWFVQNSCGLSAIVVAEIRQGLERSLLKPAKRQLIEAVLEPLEVLP